VCRQFAKEVGFQYDCVMIHRSKELPLRQDFMKRRLNTLAALRLCLVVPLTAIANEQLELSMYTCNIHVSASSGVVCTNMATRTARIFDVVWWTRVVAGACRAGQWTLCCVVINVCFVTQSLVRHRLKHCKESKK
jgi:hypothetical protein